MPELQREADPAASHHTVAPSEPHPRRRCQFGMARTMNRPPPRGGPPCSGDAQRRSAGARGGRLMPMLLIVLFVMLLTLYNTAGQLSFRLVKCASPVPLSPRGPALASPPRQQSRRCALTFPPVGMRPENQKAAYFISGGALVSSTPRPRILPVGADGRMSCSKVALRSSCRARNASRSTRPVLFSWALIAGLAGTHRRRRPVRFSPGGGGSR